MSSTYRVSPVANIHHQVYQFLVRSTESDQLAQPPTKIARRSSIGSNRQNMSVVNKTRNAYFDKNVLMYDCRLNKSSREDSDNHVNNALESFSVTSFYEMQENTTINER